MKNKIYILYKSNYLDGVSNEILLGICFILFYSLVLLFSSFSKFVGLN